uniref:Peptidase_M13 domain-containing protein n=1 Tax=Parastrongyloides trichosuri TaxID=131310 RepID=A0A0N4ZE87_PARTI
MEKRLVGKNNKLTEKENKYLKNLYTYFIISFYLNHISEQANTKLGLKFFKNVFKDIKEVTKKVIKRKKFIDDETKEKFIEKLESLKFDMNEQLDLANKTYLEFCINSIPFNSGHNRRLISKNLELYMTKLSKKLKISKYSCNHFISASNLATDAIIKPNAYYIQTKNVVVFNLAFFMYPYYDFRLPFSLNYGTIGNIVAHEILHAFDRIGRQFDKDGNRAMLATKKSEEEIRKKEECFVEQYNDQDFNGLEDTKVNGTLTLDENISDNGSIKLAHRAYLMFAKNYNVSKRVMRKIKLTHEQLFFIGATKLFCKKRSKEIKFYAQSFDLHAPLKNRVLTMLSNYRPFSKAFNCETESFIDLENRCELWR